MDWVDFDSLLANEAPGYGAAETEWDDAEKCHYLVDEAGDEEYEKSCWYEDRDGQIVEMNG